MKFIPFKNSVEVKPIKRKSILQTNDKNFLESAEVIQLGEGVTFVKQGDIIHFDKWGFSTITDELDGIERYVVLVDEKVIKGKHEQQ